MVWILDLQLLSDTRGYQHTSDSTVHTRLHRSTPCCFAYDQRQLWSICSSKVKRVRCGDISVSPEVLTIKVPAKLNSRCAALEFWHRVVPLDPCPALTQVCVN
jgi:hypothetical protein